MELRLIDNFDEEAFKHLCLVENAIFILWPLKWRHQVA